MLAKKSKKEQHFMASPETSSSPPGLKLTVLTQPSAEKRSMSLKGCSRSCYDHGKTFAQLATTFGVDSLGVVVPLLWDMLKTLWHCRC